MTCGKPDELENRPPPSGKPLSGANAVLCEYAIQAAPSIDSLALLAELELIAYCGINTEALTDRDDVVLFDELDGRPLALEHMVAYRADDPNPNVHGVEAFLRSSPCPMLHAPLRYVFATQWGHGEGK